MNASESVGSEFKSSLDLTKITIKIAPFDPDLDRAKYTAMKECITCNSALGKGGIKKHYCKFCYNAVCSACSPLTGPHPESGKEERICNPCYINGLKLAVMDSGDEYVKFKLRAEIEEKEKEIAKRKQLALELDETKKIADQEKAELDLKVSIKSKELDERDLKVKNKADEHKKMNEFMQEMVRKGKISEGDVNNPKYLAPAVSERSSKCLNCVIV